MERAADPEEDKDQPPSHSCHLPHEGALSPFLKTNLATSNGLEVFSYIAIVFAAVFPKVPH